MQEGPGEDKGLKAVQCYCTDFVARAATLKKPTGYHPRTPDKIGDKERGVPITYSLLLCGIVEKNMDGDLLLGFLALKGSD